MIRCALRKILTICEAGALRKILTICEAGAIVVKKTKQTNARKFIISQSIESIAMQLGNKGGYLQLQIF